MYQVPMMKATECTANVLREIDIAVNPEFPELVIIFLHITPSNILQN